MKPKFQDRQTFLVVFSYIAVNAMSSQRCNTPCLKRSAMPEQENSAAGELPTFLPKMTTGKKFRFAPLPIQPKLKQTVVPRASEVVVLPQGTRSFVPMPTALQKKLSPVPCLVLGLDVGTNAWVEGSPIKGSIGEHGFYNLCRPCDLEARIVQLGWAIRDESGIAIKEKIVKPDGWLISAKAARYHGISQEIAEEQGVVLEQVLSEFLHDVHDVCQGGGRLVLLKRSFFGLQPTCASTAFRKKSLKNKVWC